MATVSLSRTLARFVVGLSYRDLPPEVVERSKVLILETLSSCFAGWDLPWSRIVARYARSSKGNATVFVYGTKAAAMDAALANAVMSHSVFIEDFVPGVGHPGIYVIPTAMAVAEEDDIPGTDLITAAVAAYDVLVRVGIGLEGKLHPGFGEATVLGPCGGTAVAAKLLKLNEDQMANALGYAANFASGMVEHWVYGSMEGMFLTGIGARNGILLADLARMGAIAAETALEGKFGFYAAFTGSAGDVKAATADLGKKFQMMQTLVKQYPACGANQAAIDSGLMLNQKYQIKARDIDRIVEVVAPFVLVGSGSNFSGPYTNQFQAQMSNQFCLAAAVLGRSVQSPRLFAQDYADPEILEIARKVELVPEEGRQWLKPRIEVLMKNGKRYIADENRLATFVPTREVAEKTFLSIASDFLGKKKATEVMDTVMNLEKLDNIKKLTGKLSR